MRISDWSSDVCSSDLGRGGGGGMPPQVVGEGSGTVKFFNGQKGFGFIVRDDGAEDVFVHISAVEQAGLPGLAEGQPLNFALVDRGGRSEEHTSELQSLMRSSYAVSCLKKKTNRQTRNP